MEDNSPQAMYRSLPPITRALMTGIVGATLLSVLGLFDIRLLLLNWPLIRGKLHLWRLITDYLFVGPFSFNWLFHMYFLVSFSSKLERNSVFADSHPNNGGGYLYFLTLQMLILDFISIVCFYPTGKPMMGTALSFAIIYYWSKREPWEKVGLWGFTLEAYQLPFALLLISILMGNSIWGDLMGLASGHLYYFLREVLPVEKDIHLLEKVPSIFINLAEHLDFMSTTRRSTPPRRPAAAAAASAPTSTSQTSTFATLFSPFSGQRPEGAAGSADTFGGRGYRLGTSGSGT